VVLEAVLGLRELVVQALVAREPVVILALAVLAGIAVALVQVLYLVLLEPLALQEHMVLQVPLELQD